MTLIVTVLVRDEVDVVAAMIEYHLAAGAAHIIATDNGSVDGTVDILAEYQRAGVLELIHEPEHTYEQAKWVTRMARRAAKKYAASWIVNADADEFWWPRDGADRPGALAATLAAVPARYGTIEAPRENLIADPAVPVDAPWADRLTVRDLLSLHEKGGRIGAKVCHRADPAVTVAQGNHGLSSDTLGRRYPASPITVLHVPDRSYTQFANKVAVGGASLAANPDLPQSFGWHWRADYERWQAGTLRETWQRRQLDAARLAAGLDGLTLVRDTRLGEHLRALLPGAVRPDLLAASLDGTARHPDPDRPRGPAASALRALFRRSPRHP